MPSEAKYYIPTEFITIRELAERTLLDNNMAFRPGQRARQFRITTINALEKAMSMKASKAKNGIYLYKGEESQEISEIDLEFINEFNMLSDEEKLSLRIIVKKLASAAPKNDDILKKVIGKKD